MSRLRPWLLGSLAALAVGCSAVPYRPGPPLADAGLERELRQSLDATYPAGFRAVHRVILTAAGRQFAFTGYLVGQAPGNVRLLAAAEIGGTAFEVIQRADGERRILRTLPGRYAARVPRDAARDAAGIHFGRPRASAVLTQPSRDTLALTECLPDGHVREFQFDAATRRLVKYLEARGHRIRYEIAFADEGSVPGWPRPVPRRITVVDPAEGYRADIRVLELKPAAPDAAVFCPEPGRAR
jgi:hypothetical protein